MGRFAFRSEMMSFVHAAPDMQNLCRHPAHYGLTSLPLLTESRK